MAEDTVLNTVPAMMMLEAMDAVSNGIVIVDCDSRITYVNEAYLHILKVSREQVMHKQISVIEPGAMILDALRDRLPRLHRPVEVKTRGKKIMVNITPIIKHQKLIGAVSVFEDITELSRSHQEFERAQRLSHSIFKAAAYGNTGRPSKFSHIIGQDPKFIRCLRLAELVAPTDATVLIEGESGAGKEVLVEAILRISGKRCRPFVNINCSAIPETLMESELFGYTSGSFTGAAKKGRAGKFELADGGTVFLDEIGEMPLFMQAKLLRALQSGEIQKIGSDTIQKVDVRVVAATNRDLKQMVRAGTFREDLYFRLNTFTIVIPPLRDRGHDIILLACHFLKKFTDKYHKQLVFSQSVMDCFLSYPWKGNVRQLESCIEYAVIVCNAGTIYAEHLPEELQLTSPAPRTESLPAAAELPPPAERKHDLKTDIAEMEKNRIEAVLEETGGNKTKAMKLLGISRRTFYKKWKKYDLDKMMSKK